MKHSLELLAPARDLACGIAAVDCGADAVYIGAPAFGARAAAGNALEDIEALIAHAHRYRVKVYAAVNTILTDDELPRAVQLLHRLYAMGADGAIIQDFGLLEEELPPIPLIASTQTHNADWRKVEFLEKVGFQRVILARELGLEEIRAIRAKTSVELEYFVHGALCVSESGRCWLSEALGGRSANRGVCAQPCRKAYTLEDGDGASVVKERHLLCLKDLSLSGRLDDLVDAGVTSFKIEGRLKDVLYVKNIVTLYRRELDGILARRGLSRASSGLSTAAFTPDAAKTFNRGGTCYFLDGGGEEIASPDTPKSRGARVGAVEQVGKGWFALDTASRFLPGDGICFFDSEGSLAGASVVRVEGARVYPADMRGIAHGAEIWRNVDVAFERLLRNAPCVRTIAVALRLFVEDGGLLLEAVDEDGVTARCAVDVEGSEARSRERAVANLEKQLLRLGGTEFSASGIAIDVETVAFFPLKALNALRRALVDKLREERARAFPPARRVIERSSFPYPAESLDYTENVLNRRAREFYLRHGAEILEGAAESGLSLEGRVVMTAKHCVKRLLGFCRKGAPRTSPQAPVGRPPKEPLVLVDQSGRRLRLRFDCARCVMELVLEPRR